MIDIITRDQWNARPPKRRTTIPTPSPEIFLHHSATNRFGVDEIRRIQNFHMDKRGWSDTAYSYLVDPTEQTIYEGRGAGIEGGHTKDHNTTSHGICVLGNYDTRTVEPEALALIGQLIAHGHAQGWWPAQLTGGHRDVRATACPGDHLYLMINEINRQANDGDDLDPFIARIQAAARRTGYTITGPEGVADEQLTAAVENMAAGIDSLIATTEDLQGQIDQAHRDIQALERHRTLAEGVRALVAKETP